MKEIILRCKNCDVHTFRLTFREPFLFISEEIAAMNDCPECEAFTEYDVDEAETINYKCENCSNVVPGVKAEEEDDEHTLSICVNCSGQHLFHADRTQIP
jgi:DNA-directed RNA polymerase subunit RPC12/RpoP